MREDVEESEESEDVGGIHPDNKSDRAGESGCDAAEQPCRQHQYNKEKTREITKLQQYLQAISLQN